MSRSLGPVGGRDPDFDEADKGARSDAAKYGLTVPKLLMIENLESDILARLDVHARARTRQN